MTTVSLILPEVGKPDRTEDVKINTAFTTIQTWANGNIGTVNLESGLLAGAWETVTLGTNIEDPAVLQSVRCRHEVGSTVVRLRGGLLATSGNTVTAGSVIATLPVGYRPPGEVTINTVNSGTPSELAIGTSGTLKLKSGSITHTVGLYLDGISFNIT